MEEIIEKPIRVENEVYVQIDNYIEKPIYRENLIKREVPKIIE